MCKKIIIVPLERIETRYTVEWYDHIPKMLREYVASIGHSCAVLEINAEEQLSNVESWGDEKPCLNDFDVAVISIAGTMPQQTATAGAFINFTSTNIWKSSQAQVLAGIFDHLNDGDVIYFTDAWNPVILMARYMADMSGKDIQIHGQWHAGYHDKYDQLFQRINKAPRSLKATMGASWALSAERALFEAIDVNYFTTEFYRDMFMDQVFAEYAWAANSDELASCLMNQTFRCGYPLGYLPSKLANVNDKEDLVLFPHRLAPEKQIDLFDEITPLIEAAGIKVDVCQRNGYTKEQYHEQLKKAKLVVSFGLQETYGIAQVEAVFAGAVPLMPNRLSYAEIYSNFPQFLYNEDLEQDPEGLAALIIQYVRNYSGLSMSLPSLSNYIQLNYVGDIQICQKLLGEI